MENLYIDLKILDLKLATPKPSSDCHRCYPAIRLLAPLLKLNEMEATSSTGLEKIRLLKPRTAHRSDAYFLFRKMFSSIEALNGAYQVISISSP